MTAVERTPVERTAFERNVVQRTTVQRTTPVRSFQGHSIHAAPGVHEYAVDLVRAALPDGGRILEVRRAGAAAPGRRLRRRADRPGAAARLDPPARPR